MQKTKKRFLSALLACTMIVSLFPFAAFADAPATELPTADENGVITLTKDVTLAGVCSIDEGASLTIDLNGHKITNANGQNTIENHGTLVINDSSQGKTGVVDNINHGKAAIYNYPTGTVTLNGGTFDRSCEKGSTSEDNGGNSYYTLKNFGTMTINPGVTVQQDGTGNGGTTGKYSSLVANGWQSIGTAGSGKAEPAKVGDGATLTINGGTFKGGLNTIKNDDCGTAVIKDGTFTNFAQAVVQNHNVLTIEGGNYSAAADASLTTYGVYNCGCAAENDIGTLTITGGTFSNVTYAVYDRSTENAQVNISGGSFSGSKAAVAKSVSSKATISITGGTFSSDVKAYIPEGYTCTSQNGRYVVQNSSKLEADAVANNNTATAVVGGNYSGSEAGDSNVDTTNNTVNIDVTTGDGGKVNDSVSNSNVGITNNALNSLNNATGVQNVAITTDVATVTMNSDALGAMTTNANGDGIVLSVEKTAAADNAPLTYSITAVTSAGKPIYSEDIAAGSVTISVPCSDTNSQVFYAGANGLENMNATSNGSTLTWTTSHFSDYIVLKGSTEAIVINSDGTVKEYDTLEEAVTNSVDGDIVRLVKDVTVDVTGNPGSGAGALTIDKNITLDGNGKTITAGNGFTYNAGSNRGEYHVINVTNPATNVVIKNLTIDGKNNAPTSGARSGINVWSNTASQINVTVDSVTVKDCSTYGLTLNNANATVNGLTTSGNAWGGINVEGKYGNTALTVNDANIAEDNSIKFEQSTGAQGGPGTVSGTINGGNFQYVTTGEDVTLNMVVNGGTFATGDYTGAVDINGYLAPGLTINPSTGEVYEIPPYTGKYSYAINVADTDNGSVSVDKYATEGEKVTLTVSPDKAYKLDELTVTANGKDVDLTDNGDGTYTFTMPSSNVKVSASFVEDKDYVEPDNSITVSMTIGSNDFVINNNIVTVPDAAPYIANDRTYVPFRALGEALGAKVVWDNDARTVTYTLGDTTIVMTIGDTTYTINGVEKSMDVAPEITGDRTYVPVRFVAEGLGFKVTPLYADNGTTASVVFEK